MKKLLVIAIMAVSSVAFARGDKTVFSQTVQGTTAQEAYDNGMALVAAIEAAGETRNEVSGMAYDAMKIRSLCFLSSSEANDRDYLKRNAYLVGQITQGIDVKTGYNVWNVTVKISCEQ